MLDLNLELAEMHGKTLMLSSTCEFIQDELLRQTANNVQANSNPEISEEMLSRAIGARVVCHGDGR